MNTETVILLVDDLMFLPQLEHQLRAAGYQPLTAVNAPELTRALFTAPVLCIADLFSQSFDWERLVRMIKGPGKKAAHVPVLGFGPHVDLQLRARALEAGCTAVVARSAIVQQLPQLVQKYRWTVSAADCGRTPPPLVLEGLRLFNQGRYFECHEVLEEAWVAEPSPVRLLYQGILQIGVACLHIQRKNWRGAMKVLERGVPKAGRFAPTCMGINVARLLDDARTIYQELIRLGPDWNGEFAPSLFPTIEYTPPD